MKIKVTATITLETEIWPEDYDGVEDVKQALLENDYDKAVDAAIEYEVKLIAEDACCSALADAMFDEGDLSNIKIEKIGATAQTEAA